MRKFTVIFFLIFSFKIFAQVNPNDTIRIKNHPKDSISAVKPQSEIAVLTDIQESNAPAKTVKYNPTKAGLYSAVLPGLGQYYNKKYWKIPIVWGAIGTGVGIAIWNQNQYTRYRNAFIAQLNGQPHEFSDIPGITAEALGRVQDRQKRQRDYAIAITGLIYVLNIVDAVVDAHLYEGRKDPDLAFKPAVIFDEFSNQTAKAGLSLNYRF
ncbi:DUF5683 domain-containing protein [Chryseobacterium koreense]|uniref:DUF5683 domain-containing protein n=1 Tax=Chryseobacterium koreense CCUG 49689 TaxID=1304281 RepID=A0A0J7IX50_9FLAO|nr:DUF5683 domain-containing protein [Chryseobacterium koreense]KMQ70389.1 hypothetical protein ACM44_12530 [Chryseobacterium koreense CCUG 49689]MBB5333353.1 hypothetical protein [Chryseobacterium koreense]